MYNEGCSQFNAHRYEAIEGGRAETEGVYGVSIEFGREKKMERWTELELTTDKLTEIANLQELLRWQARNVTKGGI